MEVKYLKYCGPPDETLKYKITPWPVLTPGQPINATVTFTPAVDIFSSILQFEVRSKLDGQILTRGTEEVSCDQVPQICNLAAGETYTLSYNSHRLRTVPPGLKGIFIGKLKLFNEDQVMWSCLEAEIEN
ncbi:hypothetical protein ACROYT_G004026 [Oculina patagonica]